MDVTDTAGVRHRIGVVVPSVNTIIEPFFNRATEADTSIHAARMFLANDLSADAVIEMDRSNGSRAVTELASCRCDVIAYCCTASSVLQGPAYDERLARELTAAARTPVITVAASMVIALRALDAHRIVLASPYAPELDAAENGYFAEVGFDVVTSAGMGITDSFALASPAPEQIVDFALSVWDPSADALAISCANLRSDEVISALELEIGRPVVTATQATLWRSLSMAGIHRRLPGLGQLFETGS
jgi:maleate isomerase